MDDKDVVEELESLSAYEEPFVQQVWTIHTLVDTRDVPLNFL